MYVTTKNQARTILADTDQLRSGVLHSSGYIPIHRQLPGQVLVVGDDVKSRDELVAILKRSGLEAVCISRVGECREALLADSVAFVFCDRRLPDGTYLEILAMTQSLNRKLRLVVTSRTADWEEYLEALRHGAFELIASPCKESDVVWLIGEAQREDYKRGAFGLNKTSAA